MIKQETPYDGILCHLKDGSFLVLECSELVDVSPDKSYVIFYHTAIYLFDTSGFLYRISGHFCHTADHSLKLKPRGCHTATTRKSSQTRKVVSVCFSVRRQRATVVQGNRREQRLFPMKDTTMLLFDILMGCCGDLCLS